jgi:iron(III) transport system ATP-binding protein
VEKALGRSVFVDYVRPPHPLLFSLDVPGLHAGEVELFGPLRLDVQREDRIRLEGPNGAGKSTLLRLIAGLHDPTSGRIWFGDRDVTALGTEKRNAVMCFQSYALWPHMTVADNVRFGLKVRGASTAEQHRRIEEVLDLVHMTDYAARKPNQLSGGQQQRVALARALAVNPDCLLLDEPLSNLDAKLRHEMRSEIRDICKRSGTTTIYVTHDQKEALSVADRIAVMRAGRLVQVGRPGDLYYRPANSFVADFIGHTNLLQGTIVARDAETVRVETPAGSFTAAGTVGQADLPDRVTVSIRPEQMRIRKPGRTAAAANGNSIVGRTVETTFLGEASEHMIEVGPGRQRVKVISAPPLFDVPEQLEVEFDAADVVVLAN